MNVPTRISIVNGRLVDPASELDLAAGADSALHLADGRIVAIGAAPDGFEAERRLDASGCVVAPGLLDLAARLREPGFEYKATLESEMRAAAAGGVVTGAQPAIHESATCGRQAVRMLRARIQARRLRAQA
ncbi:MAG TPA: dihydroorotase, partial [Burkholderiaceae bacterium]|nr:dihydroorotase [Burkholderiaceae bacterium]